MGVDGWEGEVRAYLHALLGFGMLRLGMEWWCWMRGVLDLFSICLTHAWLLYVSDLESSPSTSNVNRCIKQV